MPSSAGSGAISCSSAEPPAAARVGRDGRLALAFERRGGRTVLTARRFALPLQALEPIALDDSGALCLTLLNPTGGVLGGDVLVADVALGAGAHVCLTTPSATRVYRAAGAPSVQRLTARLGAGAVLEHVPDHLIPSPGARLEQRVDVTLGPGATALLLDAFATGRVQRGEAWRFGALDLATAVRDAAGPIAYERARLTGGIPGPLVDALTEGRPYVASFVAARAAPADWASLAAALHEALAALGAPLLAGAAPLGRGGLTVRVLAASAPSLQAAVQVVWGRCRAELLGLPPLDLRKL